MEKIYNTISDPMYMNQLIESYENEEMEQWLLYLWDWWEAFYGSKNKMYAEDDLLGLEWYLNFSYNCFDKWVKTAFISLWCWNSNTEKYILGHLSDEYDISYIWVDTSEEMLNMSVKNMKDISNKKTFLRADFWSQEFKNEINLLCKWFEKKVFVFFWWTFWNIKYTKIINILYNFLWKNDQIWIDVWVRKWSTIEDDLQLFDIYKGWLTNPIMTDFLLSKIKNDGIDINSWEIILKSSEVKEIWAIQFSYYFKFNQKININIKDYKIIFLPWYNLKLLSIHRYWVDGFINLLKWHNFKLITQNIKWYDWQFLFEKE